MNFTFEEIKEKIFRSFVENGEKKMEGMIYYDASPTLKDANIILHMADLT